MNLQTPGYRALGLWLLAAALAASAVLLPPLAQPPAYHDFADQRACGGLPRCLDTVSNALFVLAGAIGLLLPRRAGRVVFASGASRFRIACSSWARFWSDSARVITTSIPPTNGCCGTGWR